MIPKSNKNDPIVIPSGAQGGKVPSKWSKMEPLGVPWAPLGRSNGPKWSPWGFLGHPWGGLGTPWEQQEPAISVLMDFRSIFDSFLEPKWRQKLIEHVTETGMKNSTKSKHQFQENLMELMCQNVCFAR